MVPREIKCRATAGASCLPPRQQVTGEKLYTAADVRPGQAAAACIK